MGEIPCFGQTENYSKGTSESLRYAGIFRALKTCVGECRAANGRCRLILTRTMRWTHGGGCASGGGKALGGRGRAWSGRVPSRPPRWRNRRKIRALPERGLIGERTRHAPAPKRRPDRGGGEDQRWAEPHSAARSGADGPEKWPGLGQISCRGDRRAGPLAKRSRRSCGRAANRERHGDRSKSAPAKRRVVAAHLLRGNRSGATVALVSPTGAGGGGVSRGHARPRVRAHLSLTRLPRTGLHFGGLPHPRSGACARTMDGRQGLDTARGRSARMAPASKAWTCG